MHGNANAAARSLGQKRSWRVHSVHTGRKGVPFRIVARAVSGALCARGRARARNQRRSRCSVRFAAAYTILTSSDNPEDPNA